LRVHYFRYLRSSFIIAAILSAVAIGQLLAHRPITARSQGRAPVQLAIITSGKQSVTIHQSIQRPHTSHHGIFSQAQGAV